MGDAAERGLVPDQATEARGRPRRPTAVARCRERNHPRGDRARRPAARPARRASRIPRVACDAPRLGRGVGPRAELGDGGLPDRHRARVAEPGDVDRIGIRGRSSLEPERALAGRHALTVVEVLHAEGHSREGPRVDAAGDHLVDAFGGATREVGIEVHERVELAVVPVDRGQGLVERLGRLHLAASHECRGLDDGAHVSPPSIGSARRGPLRPTARWGSRPGRARR